jgi:hypothetical protein
MLKSMMFGSASGAHRTQYSYNDGDLHGHQAQPVPLATCLNTACKVENTASKGARLGEKWMEQVKMMCEKNKLKLKELQDHSIGGC